MPNKRGVKINGGRGSEIFVKFNRRGVQNKREVGISKYRLISVMNEKKRHKCLILMLNLKVGKQKRSEASKSKVIIKSVSNISIN